MQNGRVLPLLTLALSLSLLSFGVWKEGYVPETNIYFNTPVSVLLSSNLATFKIRSHRGALKIRNEKGVDLGVFPNDATFTASGVANRWILNQKIITASELRLSSSQSELIHFNHRAFRGVLLLRTNGKKSWVTNTLDLEDYLLGSVGAEMYASWPLEALKAQVVAARSYAYYLMEKPKHLFYDLDASVLDQVYRGVEVEAPQVRKAVEITQGEYLSFRAKPVKAYFHARCGGVTESAHRVWKYRDQAFQKNVACPYCLKNPLRWKAEISHQELGNLLSLPSVPEIKLLSSIKSPSGRVQSVQFQAVTGGKEVTADQLRQSIGYSKLKSALFNWKQDKEKIHFFGKGMGHGVGLCQWGSRYLAQQGWSYRQILNHYYPALWLSKNQPKVVDEIHASR